MTVKKLSQREIRRTLHERLDEQATVINQLLGNDRVTQRKVTALEGWVTAWQAQTVWQRVKWLFRGV